MDFDSGNNQQFRKLLFAFPAKAIEWLYEGHYNKLVRLATNLTQNKETAEDIVQETFVHVWENHKQLGQNQQGDIIHYLTKVVKNKSITQFKKSLKEKIKKAEYLNGHKAQAAFFPIEIQMVQNEIHTQLHQLIQTFPPREKQCLLMKVNKGMKTEDIASELKVTKKAVERSITSAKKRLRRTWKMD